jgi:hypothetical protein
MSIYRGFRVLAQDVHATSCVAQAPRQQPLRPEPPPIHLRRAQPVNTLLPATASWLAAIPEKLRPTALATQFPRIANMLCATWSDPAGRGAYLEDLLTGGGRVGRRGFPSAVVRDLQRLHAVHGILCGLKRSIWSGTSAPMRLGDR